MQRARYRRVRTVSRKTVSGSCVFATDTFQVNVRVLFQFPGQSLNRPVTSQYTAHVLLFVSIVAIPLVVCATLSAKVIFTYDVEWELDAKTTWSRRWENYLKGNPEVRGAPCDVFNYGCTK